MKKNLIRVLMCFSLLTVIMGGCGKDSEVTYERGERKEQGQTKEIEETDVPAIEDSSTEIETGEKEEPLTEVTDPSNGFVKPAAEDFVYEYDTLLEGIVITKYTGEAEAICIPAQIDGDTVKAVKIPFNHQIAQIELPDSIIECSFWGCSSLTEITIPNGVTSLENNAFANCSSLTSITIPGNVTIIGKNAFHSCDALTSVTLLDGVTTIREMAFYGCSSLANITLPDSTIFIDNGVFYGCTSLTSITLPDGVRGIAGGMFSGCSNLTNINLPDSVRDIDIYAFADCSSLTSITIPDRVTSIGAYAFSGCSSLTSVTISDNVTDIGHSVFYNCDNLKVTYQGQEYTSENDPDDWWQPK